MGGFAVYSTHFMRDTNYNFLCFYTNNSRELIVGL